MKLLVSILDFFKLKSPVIYGVVVSILGGLVMMLNGIIDVGVIAEVPQWLKVALEFLALVGLAGANTGTFDLKDDEEKKKAATAVLKQLDAKS